MEFTCEILESEYNCDCSGCCPTDEPTMSPVPTFSNPDYNRFPELRDEDTTSVNYQ